MHNIQKLIDKPIILQTDGSIELSAAKDEARSHPFKGTAEARRVSEDDIQDEIGSDLPPPSGEGDSIKESIEESRQSEKQLSSARRMLGSEQAVIRSSKELLSGKRSQSGSMFDRGSFGNYQSSKVKDLLLQEGSMMEAFLDQMEASVSKRRAEEQRRLQKQLDSRQISNRVYQQKTRDIERWVSAERKEIKAKRAKVQDTCGDIASYLQRIHQDKKLMQDFMASAHSTPRGRASSGRSSHESQVSGSIVLAQD